MKEVWVDMSKLMEILNEYEGGKLYPCIGEDDTVVRVDIFGAYQVCFEIGKREVRK